jgi:two-component system sensor histidine kinase KdpD
VSADGRVEGARFWFTLPVETPPDAPDSIEDEGGDALSHADTGGNSTLNPFSKPNHE